MRLCLMGRFKLIQDLAVHASLAAIFSALIYINSRDMFYALLVILGGIFIDLDHLLDHFLFFKNRFNILEFIDRRFLDSGKVYVFLHSWELNILFFILSFIFKSYALFIFSLSLAIHLAVDNAQRARPLFYFLSYRISKRFDVDLLLPEEIINNNKHE